MNVIYNLIQILLVPLFIIIGPLYLIIKPSRRANVLNRLGSGLDTVQPAREKTIWVHALSVGEVTSAQPLIRRLASEKKENLSIVFSTTTKSGHHLAEKLIAPYCHSIIYFPFDIAPVIKHFLGKIKPDLFILIETDFWPNFLHLSAAARIPMLLFNGRVSDRSMKRYQRFSFVFKPMFETFQLLCMQTDSDAQKMRALGIDPNKIKVVGNLKFSETSSTAVRDELTETLGQSEDLLIFGGSTHGGEEKIMIDGFSRLKHKHAGLHLVIAPRNIERCDELVELIGQHGLTVRRFSLPTDKRPADVTLIDTIGDLAGLYQFADISFIGGSLAAEGGHNPLEAARFGCPILFGPHMDDFSEISSGLLNGGGALQISDEHSMFTELERLITDDNLRNMTGEKARQYSTGFAYVLTEHLQIIDRFL